MCSTDATTSSAACDPPDAAAPIDTLTGAAGAGSSPSDLHALLSDAREDERRRLSRRLHDGLGQLLAALQLDLDALREHSRHPDGHDLAQGRLAQAIEVVRFLADEWRPVALDDLGLNDALDALARRSARQMGIEVTLRCDDQDPPVSPRLAAALYRCVQEALRNVADHARATDVSIELFCDDAQVQLRVQDNGVGPATAGLPEGRPLEGLGLRIGAFGGTLILDRAAGAGACLSVSVPADGAGTRRAT